MRFEQVQDPAVFKKRASPILAEEARHNLILGILGTLIRDPRAYDDFRLFLVSDRSGAVGAALMTVPYNLILADADDDAIEVLIAGLRRDQINIPGVIGNRPTVDAFVGKWPDQLRRTMAQGVFALEHVEDLETFGGEPRVAVEADAELIAEWMDEFAAEALPDEPHDSKRMRRAIRRRLNGEAPGAYWFWQDSGRPVAMTGHGGPTGRGIRIGPVYTPPELRGRGYATGLVEAQSRWLLDNGYDYCFLYTDLANPTSNRIYERIGYRQVAESASYVGFS